MVAIASLTSEAIVSGITRAYAGGQTTIHANSLDIHAKGTNTADSLSTITGAGGITGTGASSTATITQDTSAYIAGGANVTAPNVPIFLTAESPNSSAQGKVVTVSVGAISVAVVLNSANAGGTTSAYVGGQRRGHGGLAHRALDLVEHVRRERQPRRRRCSPAAAGLNNYAKTTSTTSAYVDTGAMVDLGGGAASFTANDLTNTATAEAVGVSVSVASVQVLDVEANAGGTTEAYVAGGLNAGTLDLHATSINTATPNTTTVTVGGGLVTVSKTIATVSQDTEARLKSGADVTLTGAATFTAISTSTPDGAHGRGQRRHRGGAAQTVTTNLGGSTGAGSDTGAKLSGTSLTASATSTNSQAGHNDVCASFVGVTVLLGGSVPTLTSNVTQSTDASLGGNIQLSGAASLTSLSNDLLDGPERQRLGQRHQHLGPQHPGEPRRLDDLGRDG